MSTYISFLIWPMIAALVIVVIHVYFGMHVIRRGIIFADLAMAQTAAFGMTIAALAGLNLEGPVPFAFGLAAAMLAALLFTATNRIEKYAPQEAIIGLVYAFTAAGAVLAVSHSAEGAEHIEHLLVGSLLTVSPEAVLKTAGIYAVIGVFHWVFRQRFLALSLGETKTVANKPLWDFLFYATFALTVTLAVTICGVLLVFVFLVAPSVFAAILSRVTRSRLILGWFFGVVGSALGMVASVWLDTPTGATIVCAFGVMLGLFGLWRVVTPTRQAL